MSKFSSTRRLVAAVSISACSLLLASTALAGPQYLGSNGFAVSGYDPVAYFTAGTPTPGSETYQATHNGATFLFSSAENRDLFTADPARYAPQFDGHCAYGAAVDAKVPGAPEHWKIVDGKLYLNVAAKAQELWEADIPGHLATAQQNWTHLEPQPPADPQ